MEFVQSEVYLWTKTAINLLWMFLPFATPFILMATVVRIFRWSNRAGRGTDLEELTEEYWQVREHLPQRARQLRRAGEKRGAYVRDRFR